ncbi:unnamed protein product [Paramecium primaurelia]|uniref:Tetratricopeptide repeat protein n=1 Tax=Paramecium primaurelia TaxID=5886 RepID=A0A8S1KBA6_PARPR|nr:unnamed protein product [Paramecium primaurelia]
MINTQIDFKRDISVNDGIENLILGDHEKAQNIFITLSQQKQDQESVIWLAYCQQLQKKYHEAINTLRPLGSIQENRLNPQIWYISMMSVIGLQNYKDALYCIQKYLKLRPQNSNGWIKAGLILLRKGEHDLAIKYLQQVLKFDKNNIEAKSYLCQAYFSTGLMKQAERQYGEILQIDQKSNFLNFIQPYMKN